MFSVLILRSDAS